MTSYAAVAIEEDPSSLRGQDLLDSDDRITEHVRHQASKICILGLRVGISLALFCVSVFMLFAAHHSMETEDGSAKASDYLANEYFPLFRYHWIIALFLTLYGCAIFVLHHYAGIEAAPLLGLSHKGHNYHGILKIGMRFTMIVFPCFILYIMTVLEKHRFGSEHIYPMVVLIACILYALYEAVNCAHMPVGGRCGTIVAGVFLAPFIAPTFAMTYVADVITSMPKALNDIEYTLCIYFAGLAWDDSYDPTEDSQGMMGNDSNDNQCSDHNDYFSVISHILNFLPFYIRLMQCLRALYEDRKKGHSGLKHIANAGKYSISIIAIGLSSFGNHKGDVQKAWWTGFTVLGAAYSFFWDVRMDWGMGEFTSKHWGLRDNIALPAWFYYCAILFDACARGPYAIYISPGQTVVKQYNLLIFGMIEMCRRALWTIIRFEKQYHDTKQDTEQMKLKPGDEEKKQSTASLVVIDDSASAANDSEPKQMAHNLFSADPELEPTKF